MNLHCLNMATVKAELFVNRGIVCVLVISVVETGDGMGRAAWVEVEEGLWSWRLVVPG